MWERLRRFSALEPPARKTFLRASALLPLISLSLRFRGFQKTRAFLQKHIPSAGQKRSPANADPSDVTVRMVRAAVRHSPTHPTCLQESLALWWLLGRQGVASELRVGVRKEANRFEAHAWVERDGIALNEPEALHAHYAAFDAALASIPTEPR
jgi:hypothetical protein